MAVERIRFSLRGWGGPEPTGTQFFELVGWTSATGFEAQPSNSSWRAALISLFAVSIEECQPGTERYEEFAVRIARGLKRAAEWLNSLSPAAFDAWRAAGKKADIFVGGWMNSDQFDLALPPGFLLACGRLGLPLTICTND
jgi:hypothetical protein